MAERQRFLNLRIFFRLIVAWHLSRRKLLRPIARSATTERLQNVQLHEVDTEARGIYIVLNDRSASSA